MKLKYLAVIALLLVIVATAFALTRENAGYEGIDEKVTAMADAYAREKGAGERRPFIDTEKGDLLLFLFAGAGLICGFYLGYQWHKWVVAGNLPETTSSHGRTAERAQLTDLGGNNV